MTIQEILFGLTFVYGVLHLLTYTTLFDTKLGTITESLGERQPKLLIRVGYLFLYFSLFYQSVFWAKYFNVI